MGCYTSAIRWFIVWTGIYSRAEQNKLENIFINIVVLKQQLLMRLSDDKPNVEKYPATSTTY